MEGQKNFSKNLDKEAKRKIIRCLERRLSLEERTASYRSKEYFANTVLARMKEPDKAYDEILKEEAAKTSGESFLFYVSALSKLISNKMPRMEELEKVVKDLERLAISIINSCNFTAGKYINTKRIIINEALEKRNIKNKKLGEVIWNLTEENDSLEEAIEKSFGTNWTKNQIDEFFGTEIYEDPKFIETIDEIVKEVRANQLVEEYCNIKGKRRKYPFKLIMTEAIEYKLQDSNISVIKCCSYIWEKYTLKYNIPSVYSMIIYLLDELGASSEVNRSDVVEMSKILEQKLQIFINLISKELVVRKVA